MTKGGKHSMTERIAITIPVKKPEERVFFMTYGMLARANEKKLREIIKKYNPPEGTIIIVGMDSSAYGRENERVEDMKRMIEKYKKRSGVVLSRNDRIAVYRQGEVPVREVIDCLAAPYEIDSVYMYFDKEDTTSKK